MRIEDADRVSNLAGQLGHPATPEDIRQRFSLINESPSAALFVACHEDWVAGWVQVNRESQTLVAEARAEISALVVDEKFRGMGFGAGLVRAAEDWAKAKKLIFVRVRSNIIRERTHRFYQREGYSIKKSWHLFTKKLAE